MSWLALEGIEKRFGSVTAIRELDLELPEGRLVSFLGPSGCGKTTLLRIIAGLEEPSRGVVRLDGEDITAVPAHLRNFGMVFQSLALFPHLSVGDNIAYGLRVRRVPRARWRQRVEELLELVQLPGVAGRHISQLSGGQRQRVAIARALALEPRLFLLDEPLGALDAKLREAMQVELRLLQQRLGITTIVVTHDQREAMTMSDLVVVMEEGRIRQAGSPLDIYRRPANSFVAGFIGTSNLIPARLTGERHALIGDTRLAVEEVPAALGSNTSAVLSIRPEDVRLLPGEQPGSNRLIAHVTFVRDVGATIETHLQAAGFEFISIATPRDRPEVATGDTVTLELPPSRLVVLES